jgi:hypothetical protein
VRAWHGAGRCFLFCLVPILYVGFVTINEVGVYNFDREGNLTFVNAVDNPGPTNCPFLINKAATRMYTVDKSANALAGCSSVSRIYRR